MMNDRKKRGGSYLLVIRVSSGLNVQIGKLGTFHFPRGYFIYCGSAAAGIEARVQRHRKTIGKRLHWHVDYLLDSPRIRVVEAYAVPDPGPGECELAEIVSGLPGAYAGPPGFGASDCRSGCAAHLIGFSKKPNLESLEIGVESV
jgi:Uri superfamily endonuclease